MSDSQNIEIVLHMVNKMCGELVDKGHEYFLVTANPSKALNIGSAKGRQFLHANRDVVHRFIKHCYDSESTHMDIIKFEVENDTPPYTSRMSSDNPDDQDPEDQNITDFSSSTNQKLGSRGMMTSEQDGSEENQRYEETEDMDCYNDFSPSLGHGIATPGLMSSAGDLTTKKKVLNVSDTDDQSDRESVTQSPENFSALKDKKAMMKTMGLTEKQIDKAFTPVTRKTCSSSDRNEEDYGPTRKTRSSVDRKEENQDSVQTPSPVRKVRSSRNCSTPVWLDLIPKQKQRRQKGSQDSTQESKGDNGVRKQQKITENYVPEKSESSVKVKCNTRQALKRKSELEDKEKIISSKKSKESPVSDTIKATTHNKQLTESVEQSRQSKRLASRSEKGAASSVTPVHTRLSERLTVKIDKKTTPFKTPKETRLSKRLTSEFDEKTISSEISRQDEACNLKEITSDSEGDTTLCETQQPGQRVESSMMESEKETTLPETQQIGQEVNRSTIEPEEETTVLVTIKQEDTAETPEHTKVSSKSRSKKGSSGSPAVTESKCDVCGKIYSSMTNMRRHRITHSNFKAYKCSFCSQRFHFVQYLREHVVGCLNNPQRVKYRDHERMRPSPVMMKYLKIVASPDEPDTFINLPVDSMHEKLAKVNSQEEVKNLTAENTEEEILEVLNKVKASQPEVNLQEARRVHRQSTKELRSGINSDDWMTEDGQYKCYICEKKITNQYNLYRHLQTHTESRRYKCTFCQKRFAVGQYLKDHVISCAKNKNRVTSATNRRQVDPEVKQKIVIVPSTVEEGTFVNAEIGENTEDVGGEKELDLPGGSYNDKDTDLEVTEDKSLQEEITPADDGATGNLAEISPAGHAATGNPAEFIPAGDAAIGTPGEITPAGDGATGNPVEITTAGDAAAGNPQEITLAGDAATGNPAEITPAGDAATGNQEEVYRCSVREWNNYYAHRSYDGTGRSIFKLSPQLIDVFKKEKELGDERKKKKVSTPYHCSVCNLKQFSRSETLRRHLFSHMGDNLKCEICSMVFRYQDYLKCHVLQQHFGVKRKRKSRSIKRITSQLQSSGSNAVNSDKVTEEDLTASSGVQATNGSQISDDKGQSSVDKGQSSVDEDQSSVDEDQNSDDEDYNPEEESQSCGNSGKVFKTKSRLKVHKTMGMKKGGKKSNLKNKLDRKCVTKLQNFQNRILFQCVECENKFFKYENLLWHQYNVHGLASFTKCPVCSEAIDNGGLLSHLIERHKSYQCKQKVDQPVLPQYTFQCNQCDKTFTKELTMLIHQQKHMSDTDQGDPTNGNQCPLCKVSFVTFGNMRRHFKVVHSDEKPYMCHLCGKSFKTNDTLKCHVKIHDREKHFKFHCKTCGKGFFRSRLLKDHETLHIPGATTCMCDICGKRFRLKPNLHKHMNSVHNVERNHVCQSCGKTFKLKEQLKNHMRYHVIKDGKVGEIGNKYGKIYQCEVCGKFCPSSYSLKIHKTSHSSERPFSCEVCGRKFKVKSKLVRHVQTVHNLTGKRRPTRKPARTKPIKTPAIVKEEDDWSSQSAENIAGSIVEVIVNNEAELVENKKMYSLLDHSYRPATSTQHFSPNDQLVINEAVKGITELGEDEAGTNYIIQDVQEVEDQPGMFIVSTDNPGEGGTESNEPQSFSLSVDEGPETLIYYITTD